MDVNMRESSFPSLYGSSRVGFLPGGTTHGDIVKVFGTPQHEYDSDSKIRAEWIGTIDCEPFSIYDYKTDICPKDNKDWHIGGYEESVTAPLIEYFKEKMSNMRVAK